MPGSLWRLRRSDVQYLQSVRPEMRSLRSVLQSVRSAICPVRPLRSVLHSVRAEMRSGSRLPGSATMLRIPSVLRSVFVPVWSDLLRSVRSEMRPLRAVLQSLRPEIRPVHTVRSEMRSGEPLRCRCFSVRSCCRRDRSLRTGSSSRSYACAEESPSSSD